MNIDAVTGFVLQSVLHDIYPIVYSIDTIWDPQTKEPLHHNIVGTHLIETREYLFLEPFRSKPDILQYSFNRNFEESQPDGFDESISVTSYEWSTFVSLFLCDGKIPNIINTFFEASLMFTTPIWEQVRPQIISAIEASNSEVRKSILRWAEKDIAYLRLSMT
jgi:hypothetical protein